MQHRANPFSVHSIVSHAARHYNKSPGQWFGAAALACTLVDLNSKYRPFADLELVLCADGLINPVKILESATSECTCDMTEELKSFEVVADMHSFPISSSSNNSYVYVDEY